MLRFGKSLHSFKGFKFTRAFSSSTATYNPYYILGVEKDMSFDEIKKQYYKLAAEYHPDINKSPDASKQFVTIKEAFETIKKWHGKTVKMDFDGGSRATRSGFTSVRPNAEQYTDEFSQDERQDRDESDYKEWAYKASQSAEHSQFADSFETIHDIKDIKFRPSDVDVPDASARFKLNENKAHISKFSDSSGFYLIFVVGIFLIIFVYSNKTENVIIDEQMDNMIYNLKNKDEYRELSLDEKENVVKNISMDLRTHKEYVEFIGKLEGKKAYENSIKSKFMPDPKPFIVMKSE